MAYSCADTGRINGLRFCRLRCAPARFGHLLRLRPQKNVLSESGGTSMRTKRRITPLLVPLFVIAAIAGPTGGRAAAAAAMFSGQATVINGQVAGMPVVLVD